MVNNGTDSDSDVIRRELLKGGRALGRAMARGMKPDSLAGVLLAAELLTPLLIDFEHHGLTVSDVRELLLNIARSIYDAEKGYGVSVD